MIASAREEEEKWILLEKGIIKEIIIIRDLEKEETYEIGLG